MNRIVFIFRVVGILFLPVMALALGAIIWQNSDVIIEKFSLLGGWWGLEAIRLSDLLVWFLFLGAAIVFGFLLLLHSERKLRRKLVELRDIKKQSQGQAGASVKTEAKKKQKKQEKSQPQTEVATEENETSTKNETKKNEKRFRLKK